MFLIHDVKIVQATIKDHQILSEITKSSKAFWNYSQEQLFQWNDELTISKEYIQTNFVYKLLFEDEIIGYYSYFNLETETTKLDNLFILPNYIGKGFGNYLMNDFLNRIKKNQNTKKVLLEADPNAEKFYQKLGFISIGQLETSIKDRFLPIMELKLN